jgi:hypothetical protein
MFPCIYRILRFETAEFRCREAQKKDATTGAEPIKCIVRLIAKRSLIEEEAIKQMEATAQLPRMRMVVGLPDLHPGKGFPIGSASVSEGVIYPHLVGADIGCGMTLFKTTMKDKKPRLDQWTNALQGLEQGWGGDTATWLKAFNAPETEFDASGLGTIGSGNHFAELQSIEKIADEELFNSLGLDAESLYLLVHSGSRAYGESVLNKHLDTHGHRGLLSDSDDAKHYLNLHDGAMRWAKANRHLIAHRFLSCLTNAPIDTHNITVCFRDSKLAREDLITNLNIFGRMRAALLRTEASDCSTFGTTAFLKRNLSFLVLQGLLIHHPLHHPRLQLQSRKCGCIARELLQPMSVSWSFQDLEDTSHILCNPLLRLHKRKMLLSLWHTALDANGIEARRYRWEKAAPRRRIR